MVLTTLRYTSLREPTAQDRRRDVVGGHNMIWHDGVVFVSQIVSVPPVLRSTPLNRVPELADGSYVAFLTDDLDAEPSTPPPATRRRISDLYTRIDHHERELGARRADEPPLRLGD